MTMEQTFLLFMLYSVIGWVGETIYMGIEHKKVLNRGFLLGPYCPIYGTGAIASLHVLNGIDNLVLIFILGTILCGVIEYITSYIMEKLFKARWWDYSQDKYNLNGRIKLSNLLLFGIGIVILFIINPYISRVIYMLDVKTLHIIFSILFIIYLADNFVTLKAMLHIKGIQTGVIKDNTEEIKAKIIKEINNSNFFNKRIIRAFPRYGINFDIIEQIRDGKVNLSKN